MITRGRVYLYRINRYLYKYKDVADEDFMEHTFHEIDKILTKIENDAKNQ